MVEKGNFSTSIIAGKLRSVLGGDPSRILIVPGSENNPCFVSTQRHNYIVKSLRAQIKDQGKLFEWTEKNLSSLFIFRRGNFAKVPDSFLAVGKDCALVLGSVLPNTELDLAAFATGTDDNPRILAVRACFPAMPEGVERKNSDGFVAVTRDPRIIVDWGRQVRISLNIAADFKERLPCSEDRGPTEQGQLGHKAAKEG